MAEPDSAASDASRNTAVPPLVGLTEAASLLGVTKQRVDQLRKKAAFPEPVARLASGPVWLLSEVEAFAQTRATKPGPVPTERCTCCPVHARARPVGDTPEDSHNR